MASNQTIATAEKSGNTSAGPTSSPASGADSDVDKHRTLLLHLLKTGADQAGEGMRGSCTHEELVDAFAHIRKGQEQSKSEGYDLCFILVLVGVVGVLLGNNYSEDNRVFSIVGSVLLVVFGVVGLVAQKVIIARDRELFGELDRFESETAGQPTVTGAELWSWYESLDVKARNYAHSCFFPNVEQFAKAGRAGGLIGAAIAALRNLSG